MLTYAFLSSCLSTSNIPLLSCLLLTCLFFCLVVIEHKKNTKSYQHNLLLPLITVDRWFGGSGSNSSPSTAVTRRFLPFSGSWFKINEQVRSSDWFKTCQKNQFLFVLAFGSVNRFPIEIDLLLLASEINGYKNRCFLPSLGRLTFGSDANVT